MTLVSVLLPKPDDKAEGGGDKPENPQPQPQGEQEAPMSESESKPAAEEPLPLNREPDEKAQEQKAQEMPDSPAPPIVSQASAPAQVQASGQQAQALGVPATTVPGRVVRHYAHVDANNVIQEIVEAAKPPEPKEGERVVDVTMVPAHVGNVVDAVGNVSPPSMSNMPSAQALVPEVTPATVPGVSVTDVPAAAKPAHPDAHPEE